MNMFRRIVYAMARRPRRSPASPGSAADDHRAALMSSIARLIAVAGIALGLTAAPVATADPSDLVPPCSGNQTPEQDNCSTGCQEGAPLTAYGTCSEPGTAQVDSGPAAELPPVSSGADPNVPVGPQ